jgi:hypothetical protein
MTGNDLAVGVEQGWYNEAEARYARRQLPYLSRRVDTGVVSIGLQAVGVELLDSKLDRSLRR